MCRNLHVVRKQTHMVRKFRYPLGICCLWAFIKCMNYRVTCDWVYWTTSGTNPMDISDISAAKLFNFVLETDMNASHRMKMSNDTTGIICCLIRENDVVFVQRMDQVVWSYGSKRERLILAQECESLWKLMKTFRVVRKKNRCLRAELEMKMACCRAGWPMSTGTLRRGYVVQRTSCWGIFVKFPWTYYR